MSKTKAQPDSPLLTENEAIEFLRLKEIGVTNPKATLAYYRQQKGLKAVRFAKRCLYLREHLHEFAETHSMTGAEYGER